MITASILSQIQSPGESKLTGTSYGSVNGENESILALPHSSLNV